MEVAPSGRAATLVSLHHHPIVVPELISETDDHFLSLDEADGRKLVQLCANTGVSAILHGHFHRFSNWAGRTSHSKTMSIIGSAAGTLVIPGADEEFLEPRECEHAPVSRQVQRSGVINSRAILGGLHRQYVRI